MVELSDRLTYVVAAKLISDSIEYIIKLIVSLPESSNV